MRNIKLRLGAAFLAFVMCLGMLVACGDSGITLKDVEKDPYAAIMDGNRKYMDALSARYGDVFAVFDKIAEGTGTYSVDFKSPAAGEADTTVVGSAELALNAVVDSKTGAYSGKVTAGAQGFTTDVSLWGDKNNIALSAPAFLGEGTYGVKFDTLEADLANSELLTTLTGGMTLDDLKATLETEAGIKWDDIKNAVSIDGWKTAFDKYMTDAEALMKVKEYTVAEETLKIGETDVPVITVQYTQTKEDIEKLYDLAFDMVESMLGGVLAAAGVDLKELMTEAMAEAGNEEIYTDITEKDYLNKKTGALVAADVAYGEGLKVNIIYGEDVSKKFEMSADITMTAEGETVDMDLTVGEITEEGKSGFDVDATVKMGEEGGTVGIDIVRNDADGKFEMKGSVDGEEMAGIAGTLTYSADELKLTVDSVTAQGETTDLGLTVSAKAGGTVEAIPEYTNIITAPMTEIEGFIETVSSLFTSGDDYYYGDISGEEDVTLGEGEEITIEDLYGDMTDEEIAQFHQDLEDLGMTVDEFLGLMY